MRRLISIIAGLALLVGAGSGAAAKDITLLNVQL